MADDGETTTCAHHRMGRGEVLAAHAVGRDRPKWPGKAEGKGITEIALCKGESMLVEGHHRQPRRRTFHLDGRKGAESWCGYIDNFNEEKKIAYFIVK